MQESMNIVTVGHVDHGKSTVIGRLLADAGALPDGKLELVRENCRRNAKPFEYAFLLDALKKEQAQGITIDAARCFFSTKKRQYIIVDAPGHIEFLKNMVTGASRAEAALLVIDAERGVEENTRRHGYFLSMLGIRQVAVLVNKMDLVGYAENVYLDIRREYADFLHKIDIEPEIFIPVSGSKGDNIASHSLNMPWYAGRTVLEQLDEFRAIPAAENLPLRMPVQGVYKFTGDGDSRRIIAGTVESGRIAVGDEVIFLPSGKKTSVKTLEMFNAPRPAYFAAGQAAGFTMERQIFTERGEIVCKIGEKLPYVGVRLRANVFWLGKEPLERSKTYYLKSGTAKIEMRLEKIEKIVNASDLSYLTRQYAEKNEVAECIINLERPVAFDLAGENDSTSRFVIVDNYEISGGGIITEAMQSYDYDTRNIRWSSGGMTKEERRRHQGRGMVVWMTGLSGSGKTTIAQETEKRLVRAGVSAYILDGDKLRHGLNSDLGFSESDRKENIRRTAEVAKLFADMGAVTIVTLISPFEESRKQAREIMGDVAFSEVYVKASVETCAKRDPKNLYKKALSGEIKNFTGIDSPYEIPREPDIVIDTERWSEIECVEMLLGEIASKAEALCEKN